MRKKGLYKSIAYFVTNCTCYDMEPWQYESEESCYNEVLNDIKTGGAAGLLSGMYNYIDDVDDETQTKHIAVAAGMIDYYLNAGMLSNNTFSNQLYNRYTVLFYFPGEKKQFKMFVYATDRENALQAFKSITSGANITYFIL